MRTKGRRRAVVAVARKLAVQVFTRRLFYGQRSHSQIIVVDAARA
ncbi:MULTISPECIES: hypothetical protein [Ruegeria]|nr:MULTISPECIES: hypothetical protein [Ruegeria]